MSKILELKLIRESIHSKYHIISIYKKYALGAATYEATNTKIFVNPFADCQSMTMSSFQDLIIYALSPEQLAWIFYTVYRMTSKPLIYFTRNIDDSESAMDLLEETMDYLSSTYNIELEYWEEEYESTNGSGMAICRLNLSNIGGMWIKHGSKVSDINPFSKVTTNMYSEGKPTTVVNTFT